MLLLPKHRFAFLCMPKTGTTAIEHSLRRHAQVITTGLPPFKHVDYAEFEEFFWPFLVSRGNVVDLEDFRVVTAMREPIEWRYSWYRYRRRAIEAPERSTGAVTFFEFLEEHFSRKPKSFARLRSPAKFLMDRNGDLGRRLALFRYEDFDQLVGFISARLGAPLKVPQKNVSPVFASEEDIRTARAAFGARLAEEYRLYESVAANGAVATTAPCVQT